jgi:glycosyltransferase involved in cell wall biosynthesis
MDDREGTGVWHVGRLFCGKANKLMLSVDEDDKLKIGIYDGKRHPTAGGSFAFQDDLINTIIKVNSRHEIYIIKENSCVNSNEKILYINLEDYQNLVVRLVKKMTREVVNKDIFVANALDKAVKENNIDLVWFISPAVSRVTVPYIMTLWDLAHRVYPYFPEVSVTGWKWEDRERHYRTFLPRAAYIITGTQAGKEEVLKYYQVPENVVKVVPFPTPALVDNQTAPSSTLESNEVRLPENYLFYPAQFWPHKNHVGLLLALKILREKYRIDLKLVLTGSDKGNMDYVREKIKELDVGNHVLVLGFVGKEMLLELYRNAFALVYATFFGPDNLPPLEAFALGCPVIASDVSGAQEQMGDAAILFNPKDPDEIAQKVKMLYEDPVKRDQLIQKGYLRAKKWTIQGYINQILTYVDEFEPVRRCWSSDKGYVYK